MHTFMNWSFEFETAIRFGKSKHYVRLMWLLTVFTIGVLYQSGLPVWGKAIAMVYALDALWLAIRNAHPEPLLDGFRRHDAEWILRMADGQEKRVKAYDILLDNGICFIWRVYEHDCSTRYWVFRDQLDECAYVQLYRNSHQNKNTILKDANLW